MTAVVSMHPSSGRTAIHSPRSIISSYISKNTTMHQQILMMMASPPASLVLSLLLTLAALRMAPSSSLQGLRMHLIRITDSSRNLSKLELLQCSLKRDDKRLLARTAAAPPADGLRATLHPGHGECLVDLAIGNPSVPFPAILDTGSDLIWTQCKPCLHCYPQRTPVFDPSASSTFSKLPCSSGPCHERTCNGSHCLYTYGYAGQSETRGILASETFTFGTAAVPGIAFGCGHANRGTSVLHQASGLVGLGRGPLSLVSQLGFSKFAYCLARTEETTRPQSPLLLGSLASFDGISGDAAVKSTPIVRNRNHPSFYYLSLHGITVGDSLLNISSSAFAIGSDGGGGLIIDSGTSITYLRAEGYREVRKAFVSQVDLEVVNGSRYGFDLCFKGVGGKRVAMPKLVFHFEGAELELPEENYIVEGQSISTGGLRCLAMGSFPFNFSVFGNYQQQGFLFLYDLEKDVLSFAPAQCEQL